MRVEIVRDSVRCLSNCIITAARAPRIVVGIIIIIVVVITTVVIIILRRVRKFCGFIHAIAVDHAPRRQTVSGPSDGQRTPDACD